MLIKAQVTGSTSFIAGNIVVILLCGGDKSTQSKDIKRAKAIAGNLDMDHDH